MIASLQNDRFYIENKYHLTSEPFDPFRRMWYHGAAYDPETGWDDAEMAAALTALAIEDRALPHPVRKARAFACVLDHGRIDVNEHDWFVGFYNWGRPLSPTCVDAWGREVFDSMPDVRDRMALWTETGAVMLWADFDHVIPDWDALLRLGFPGTLARAERLHAEARAAGKTDGETEAFYEGVEQSYAAVLRVLDRYVKLAETKTHAKAAKQAACLRRLRDGAPQTTYDALQMIYLFFLFTECVDHYQTRSLGNGLDATLRRFVQSDLAAGVPEDEIREVLAYFLLQFSAIGNYWGHPFYLGGTAEDGGTLYDGVSRMILEVYRELGIYNPKVQLKLDRHTPAWVTELALGMVRESRGSFVFCCEPGYRRAMRSYGVTEEEARTWEISGCYETRVRGDESSTGTGYINAAKAVELALHNGKDVKTGARLGPEVGGPETFGSFDAFLAAFLAEWGNLIDESLATSDRYDPYLHVINPSNLFSGTVERCLRAGVDGYARGVKYNNSVVLNCGFATAVDSLMAVKTLVYGEGRVSLPELVAVLDADWEGREDLRLRALRCPHKYGNGDAETDALAARLSAFFCDHVANHPNARGGVYKAMFHSARAFIEQGKRTAATPDGRHAGEEESKNASPAVGADREGVTAVIRSALKMHPERYAEAFCLDLMLHPSSVAGEEGLAAMRGLLQVYMEGGGQAIQFNVFDAATLRDAQAHPEKYENLQVRVCGWNVLWNNMAKEEQEAYILRAEKAGEGA